MYQRKLLLEENLLDISAAGELTMMMRLRDLHHAMRHCEHSIWKFVNSMILDVYLGQTQSHLPSTFYSDLPLWMSDRTPNWPGALKKTNFQIHSCHPQSGSNPGPWILTTGTVLYQLSWVEAVTHPITNTAQWCLTSVMYEIPVYQLYHSATDKSLGWGTTLLSCVLQSFQIVVGSWKIVYHAFPCQKAFVWTGLAAKIICASYRCLSHHCDCAPSQCTSHMLRLSLNR